MQNTVFKCLFLCLLLIFLFSAHRIIHQSAILRGFDANVLVYSKTSAILASIRMCGQTNHVRKSPRPWFSKAWPTMLSTSL